MLERNILEDAAPGEQRKVAAPPGKKLKAAYAIKLDADATTPPRVRRPLSATAPPSARADTRAVARPDTRSLQVVLAPMDVERVVRAPTDEEEAKSAAANAAAAERAAAAATTAPPPEEAAAAGRAEPETGSALPEVD